MQLRSVTFKLATIAYTGASVGRDWTFHIVATPDGFAGPTLSPDLNSSISDPGTYHKGTELARYLLGPDSRVAYHLSVEAVEGREKFVDRGGDTGRIESSLALGSTTGMVSFKVKEDLGPNRKSDAEAHLTFTFEIEVRPGITVCDPPSGAPVPVIDVSPTLPESEMVETGGGTTFENQSFQLTFGVYQTGSEWRLAFTAAACRILWGIKRSVLTDPVAPPDAGANITCDNVDAAYQCLSASQDNGRATLLALPDGRTVCYFPYQAATDHEAVHIADRKVAAIRELDVVTTAANGLSLGSAFHTTYAEANQRARAETSVHANLWESLSDSGVASDSEDRAALAGLPAIKACLARVDAYRNKCGK